MTIGLGHYLAVGAILFTLGILGIFLNRKNIIIILMSIELILLAVNINLVAFSTFLGDIVGQVFALLVLTVAAAEAAIGLAVLVVYYRNRGWRRQSDEGLTQLWFRQSSFCRCWAPFSRALFPSSGRMRAIRAATRSSTTTTHMAPMPTPRMPMPKITAMTTITRSSRRRPVRARPN